MKLTSKQFTDMIVENIMNVSDLYIDEDDIEIAQNPKEWKRNMKCKMNKAINIYGATSIEDFMEMGSEGITILDKQKPNKDCFVRHFVIPDLTLDCTVVTDETDNKVIAMLWHQD